MKEPRYYRVQSLSSSFTLSLKKTYHESMFISRLSPQNTIFENQVFINLQAKHSIHPQHTSLPSNKFKNVIFLFKSLSELLYVQLPNCVIWIIIHQLAKFPKCHFFLKLTKLSIQIKHFQECFLFNSFIKIQWQTYHSQNNSSKYHQIYNN